MTRSESFFWAVGCVTVTGIGIILFVWGVVSIVQEFKDRR